jgi:hypothetical protein
MDGPDDPVEITCEFLQKSMERAAYCTSATLPGDEFRQILKLATRRKTFAVLRLNHLLRMRDRQEVKLLGHELRSLLVLASKAHPRERRRKFRAPVPSSQRSKVQGE